MSPQWDVNLPNTGKLRFAVDYTQDRLDVQRCAEHARCSRVRPPTTWRRRSHYYSPEEKYVVTLGGSNLTDDRYLVVGSVNGAEGETVGTYNPPRQWYLGLRMKFE